MRLNSLTAASVTLSALAGLPLAAADLNVADLRLSLGFQDNNLTSTDFTDVGRNMDENWRGQVQYLAGKLGDNGGLIWGAGFALNHATWDVSSEKTAHVTTPTVDVLLGYGYAFASNFHVELTPFAGYGRAYYGVNDNDTTTTSKEWDNYFEYGIKLGAYVAFDNKVMLGLEVPFMVGRYDPEYTYNDDAGNPHVSVDEKRRCQGFGLLATVGYRF